jgi:hypothetical protein
MIKEQFQELSNQLSALSKRSGAARNSRELRSLLREKRAVLKEIDELVRGQTEWSRRPSDENS